MKRSAIATVRRTARRTMGWRPKQAGAEPLDIGKLVSPLRYDVVVRADFFRFLDAHLDRDDFAEFSRLARQHPYFTWFERVAMARFRPWVVRDRALLLDQYEERLRRSCALWMSFRRTGFDPRYPITLRRARPDARTETGVRIERTVHLGDGCHRLALLLASGERLLPPTLYRIEHRPLRIVLDNTAVLCRALDLDERSYTRFLSLGYTDREFDDLPSLLCEVRDRRPNALPELSEIIGKHRDTAGSARGAIPGGSSGA